MLPVHEGPDLQEEALLVGAGLGQQTDDLFVSVDEGLLTLGGIDSDLQLHYIPPGSRTLLRDHLDTCGLEV